MTRTAVGGPQATVAAHGLRVTLPERWEARLYLRDRPGDTEAGESMNPVLHLANFALPPGRGDFGSGAVEVMRAEHAFVALLEYDHSETRRALFASNGLPRPTLRGFAHNALQRPLPGQLGCQMFCTVHDRAFCLYVVLGSRQHAVRLIDEVRSALDNVTVGQR
jgi:hypothetical protein